MTRLGTHPRAFGFVSFIVAGILAVSQGAVQATQTCVTIRLFGATTLDCEVPPSTSVTWSPQITTTTLDLNLTNPNNGTLILTAGNNLQTRTNVATGTLTITANGNLGPNNGTLTLGGTQYDRGLRLTSGTLEIAPVPFCLACLVFSWGGSITTLGSGGTIFVDVTEAAILSGAIQNNTGLTIGAPATESGQVILSGTVSGPGGLTINGADNADCCPEVTLSGLVTGAGTITVNGGSLNVLGTVRNRADSFIGTIADTLAIVNVMGPGSWTLSGSKLVLGEAGEGVLDISRGGVVDASNGIVIGGQSGSLGTVSVSGAGSQLRTAGRIVVGNTGGQFPGQGFFDISDGGIMLGSDIIINPHGAGTLDNGTLRATGRGGVTVEGGSPFGGFLDGRGTVIGRLTNNGTIEPGLFNPGIPIVTNETLRVKGDYTQGPSGTLLINVTPSLAGRLAVVKSATLAGTLALNFLPGTYAPGATYALVTAKHVFGTFATLTENGTNNLGLLVPTLDYAPSQVTLGFTIDPLPDFAATPNQFAVASTLQQAMSIATGGDLVTVFNALNYRTPGQLQAAYAAMSGTAYTALPTVAIETLHGAAGAVFGHWDGAGLGLAGARMLPVTSFGGSDRSGRDSIRPTWWTGTAPTPSGSGEPSAFRALADTDRSDALTRAGSGFWTQSLDGSIGVTGWGDPLASAIAQTSGNLVGYDFALSPRLQIGTAIGQWQSGLTMNDGTGQSTSVSTELIAAYAQYAFGDWTLDAMAGYTSDASQVTRPIPFMGRTATANYATNDTIAAVQVGPRLHWGAMTVLPTVGVDYVQTVLPTVSESGADSLNLTVAGQSVTSVRGIVGMRLTGPDTGGDFHWTAYANYGHEFGASAFATTATLAGAPGNPFTVTGVSAAADTWRAGLGLMWRLQNSAAEIHVTYDALLSTLQTSQEASVMLDWHF